MKGTVIRIYKKFVIAEINGELDFIKNKKAFHIGETIEYKKRNVYRGIPHIKYKEMA